VRSGFGKAMDTVRDLFGTPPPRSITAH
jgi:hypothetical protein